MSGKITLQAASVQKLCKSLLSIAAHSVAQDDTVPLLNSMDGSQGEVNRVASLQGVVVNKTQPALCAETGLSLRTLARALSLLTEAGIVSSRRGGICILDAHKLYQGTQGELGAEGGRVAGGMVGQKVAGWRVVGGTIEDSAVASLHAELESLRASLAMMGGEVANLRAALSVAASEVENLRTALHSSAGQVVPAPPAFHFDVDVIVGRIVEELRGIVIHDTVPPATMPLSTEPELSEGQEGGEGEKVGDIEVLRKLLEVKGSQRSAALVLRVGKSALIDAVKGEGSRVAELAAKARAVLASLGVDNAQ